MHVIEVEHLTKEYRLGALQGLKQTLLNAGSRLTGRSVPEAPLFKALDGFDVSYREIDPDVFGEELEREDYADVDRVAVVGLVAVKR